MSACTFFGHRDCNNLDCKAMQDAIEKLINQGVSIFYVGHEGQFDGMVYRCLKQLRKEYPHILVCVVLAYLPTKKREWEDLSDTIYPEIEGHPKFAIARRNRWMVEASDYCICYINHTWGGAYKFTKLAKQLGKTVINISNTNIEL